MGTFLTMTAYITINIDPILIHIGSFSLRWYSLIMVVAAIVGAFIFAGQLRRKEIEPGHVVGMLVVVVPSAIVGARLFSVLDNYGYYSHHLLAVVRPPYIGLAIYGVLTGSWPWRSTPREETARAASAGLPGTGHTVRQIIGRFANIINGDTWGSPTHLPWGFVYKTPQALLPANLLGVPTHPTPVYEHSGWSSWWRSSGTRCRA